MRSLMTGARRAQHARKDPAPSRLKYRLQRFWMTPSYRRAVTRGLPALMASALIYHVSTSDAVQTRTQASMLAAVNTVKERPEFQLQIMRITGASDALSVELRGMLGFDFPMSSFDLDLDKLREKLEAVDAVKSAAIFARTGGMLDIQITERQPVAVWRNEAEIEVLDAEAVRVRKIATRAEAPFLPLIVGEGVKPVLDEAMLLVATAAPIKDQLRGIVRIGERRWDIVLEEGLRINLPETDPVEALERVLALHQAQQILNRDITLVDMRDGNRPVLRLGEEAQDQAIKTRY